MSTGATFALIANDGKADRMITATRLLNQRIVDIMCSRKRLGRADVMPTLADIERTHILFMNAHFKPFAAIGFEYNKVHAQSGTAQLNNTVTFSIPQFGDFFADMVVRTRLSAATASTSTAPTQGVDASFPPNAAPNFYSLVDAFGNTVNGGDPYQDLVRYCEYPANKLFTNIKFDVNGNPLDEYTDLCTSMYQKFRVQPNKEVGYNRLVGQEVPIEAISGPASCPVTDNDPANAAVVLANDVSRAYRKVVNGPQTPKLTQPALDLWHPLELWFNKDVRLAVPSVSIPHGQRFITLQIEAQNRLLFTVPNLYLKTTVDTGAGAGNSRDVTYSPITSASSVVNPVSIEQMEMYINNIFVNPEIHDIYIKRVGFSLIRVHRMHTAQQTASNTDVQLTQLKWPIEYIYVCYRPTWNASLSNPQLHRDWHRCGKLNDAACPDIKYKSEINSGNAASDGSYSEGSVIPDTYPVAQNTVTSLTVLAHGIRVFDSFLVEFFQNYLPFNFGGHNIRTPEDGQVLMVNFALYPGTYQPSSHLNISRAREFYFQHVSSYISPTTPADLLACAIAINFLLITDGSAVLRYST